MSHGFQKIHLSDDDQHANSYNRPNFKDRKSFLKITGFCLGFLFAFSIVFYQYDPAFRMGNALSLISEPTLVTTGTDSESEGVSRPSHGTVRIETLDPALLPSPETKGGKAQRLVVVGDVHGCIEECKSSVFVLKRVVPFKASFELGKYRENAHLRRRNALACSKASFDSRKNFLHY